LESFQAFEGDFKLVGRIERRRVVQDIDVEERYYRHDEGGGSDSGSRKYVEEGGFRGGMGNRVNRISECLDGCFWRKAAIGGGAHGGEACRQKTRPARCPAAGGVSAGATCLPLPAALAAPEESGGRRPAQPHDRRRLVWLTLPEGLMIRSYTIGLLASAAGTSDRVYWRNGTRALDWAHWAQTADKFGSASLGCGGGFASAGGDQFRRSEGLIAKL
jgi:hypothetical protein